MKVTVRLAGSCRRMGGVDGHLEQWVGFAGVLFGNEHSSIDNKHLTVASCWFSLLFHNLLTMHGHRNLKQRLLFVLRSIQNT